MKQRFTAAVHLVGHHANKICTGAFGGAVLLGLILALVLRHHHGSVLLSWPALVAMGVLVVVLLGVFRAEDVHDRTLCEACAELTPLNGPLHAERKNRRLRLWHWRRRRRNALGTLGAVFTAFVCMVAAAFHIPPLAKDVADWTSGLLLLVFLPFGVYYNLSCDSHRVLQPWCPLCHWGDGGGGFHEPSPNPSGGRRLPLPTDGAR